MTTFFVVGNVNGPISKYVEAGSADDVQAMFDAGGFIGIDDECATDAEDMLVIEMEHPESTTSDEFDALLRSKGLRMVRGLDECAMAGAEGWYLWEDPIGGIQDSEFVLCTSDDGWSLHAPGCHDEDIASGDAPTLVSGTGAAPTPGDYDAARAALFS